MLKRFSIVFLITTLIASIPFLLTGCNKAGKATDNQLIMATTTSVEDTGLLDYLLPGFEKDFGCRVKAIAVGSGEAMKMGSKGDADILLVHSPKDEQNFMDSGNASKRKTFMFNYFLIVGPKNDPAGLSGSKNVKEAMLKLAGGKGLFVSRGDESGTHKRELKLWQMAGKKPQGRNYVESGQSMGETLMLANERNAYTLSDKGTYLSFADKTDSAVFFEEVDELLNQYSVIVVNKKKFKNVNEKLANNLYDWITSIKTLEMIGGFKRGKLFFPYK